MSGSVISRIRKLILPCACTQASQEYGQQTIVFPPEVVEKILERIRDDETLFVCRLVNRQWSDIVSDLLERRRLKHWTSWHPNPFPQAPFWPPSIWQNRKRKSFISKDFEFAEVRLPPALKGFRAPTRNPFPSKSISIFRKRSYLNKKAKGSYSLKTKWDVFWIEMGPNLTSIILYEVKIKLSQLSVMLTSTPNLKALAIYLCKILYNQSLPAHRLEELQNQNINISSNLQHLHLIDQRDELFRSWLIDKCAHQLVSLTMARFSEEEEEWYNLQKLVNLKHLKFFTSGLVIVRKIEDSTASIQRLECLSIALFRINEMSRDSLCSIMSFISKSSRSLVHLHLNFTEEMLLTCLEANQIIFPNVCVLGTLVSNKYTISEKGLDKQHVLNWFPIAECVIFTPPLYLFQSQQS